MELNNEVIKKEILKLKNQVLEYKKNAEANIVGAIYKNIELIYNIELQVKDFDINVWKVYYAIANQIILKEKKEVLDDITIGLYLEKHGKLKEKYEQYKGFSTIRELVDMVKEENFEGYVEEFHKWGTVLTLLDRGFLVDIKECIDMNLSEIYDLLEALLNDSFVKNISEEISGSYDIADNLEDLINELDKGLNVGLPYQDMPIINSETGGMLEGNLTLIGALSGIGKSSFVRSVIIPSILQHNEKILVMLNEEDENKWRAELLVWIANNIYNFDIQKHKLRNGGFTQELKDNLLKCAKWLEEKKNQIIIIPFKTFKTSTAIKLIKKYHSAFGVKYAILDTLKLDAGSDISLSWLVLAQNVVKLYDTIKKSNKSNGVHLVCTFQLGKDQATHRFYSQNSIGLAKNIIDVASTCLMLRKLWDDEYPDEKNEIKVFKMTGKNNMTKIPIQIDKNKKYIVLFIPKNRFGASEDYQVLLEMDLSRNQYKEVGICTIFRDY